jgi:phage baseplate assembly protein W
MDIDTPQIDLPFRLDPTGREVVCVEQDELQDIANSVETLLRTPLGFLEEQPDYGVADGTFDEGYDAAEIMTAITQWEERADVMIESNPDLEDVLITRIAVNIGTRSHGDV